MDEEKLKKEIKELIYYNEREINKLKIVFEELQPQFKDLKEKNKDLFDLLNSYFCDLLYFYKKGEIIKTFELSNYIWGYLDCLANLKIIKPNKKIKRWFKVERDY